MTTRARRAQSALILLVAVIACPFGLAAARQDVNLERDVLPAVVQVAVRIVESGGGVAPAEQLVPRGSGTVIAPEGLVLTSAHVLDVRDLVASAEARQAEYKQQGLERSVSVLADEFVLLFPLLPDEEPIPLYTATAERVDADLLDLAVLRITGGPKNQPVNISALPFVPLGDSNLLGRGDEIAVVGYPGIAHTAIVDTGEINGFETADGIPGRAWIVTDATVSGGSSGGAAVDGAGRLIGVITLASELDCRPDDTNDDGVVDELDIGCVPVGSALARLRPIDLALPLLAAAGVAPPPAATPPAEPSVAPAPPASTPPTVTPTPAPPTPTQAPVPAGVTDVDIRNFAFAPDQMTVAAGATVTWTNNDSVPHSVTADNGSLDSGTLQPGEQFTHTFDQPGTFAYHCAFHPSMRAEITIESEATGDGEIAAPIRAVAGEFPVDIRDFAFSPNQIEIAVGDTVTWTNQDPVPHTATGENRDVLQSGTISPGSSFSQTFTQTGEFPYFCEFHSNMTGTIVVQ